MKKLLCVLLAFLLLFSSSVIAFSAEKDGEITFAVASDLHYNLPREELTGEIDDPVYWYANRRAAMEDESGFIIDEFLKQCAENEDCEFVLIAGDLVDHGKTIPEEHEVMAEKLRQFEAQTGKQVYVINGNHDCGLDTATEPEDFVSIYDEFGYAEAIARDDDSLSYAADLNETYRLIALDSNDPTKSTEDGMDAGRVDWVVEQAKQAQRDGKYPILMMHHNLLDHMPMQRILSRNFIIKNHFTTAATFADCGIQLVFSGHEHCSDAAVFTSALGNRIYDLATTSLTMYPLQYRLVTLSDSAITYEAATVDTIDTDALTDAVNGYSAEQLALMQAGLNDYAKGFLKKGVEYRLALSMTPEKMGLDETAFYYESVIKLVNGLTDLLEMPLHGENSIQELAKKYQLEIPDSDYQNGWDLATELVAAHYAGEESRELDSPEVTILLRMAAVILREDLGAFGDEYFADAADAILVSQGLDDSSAELQGLCRSVFGEITPAEYFLVALASPILYTFAYDADGVNDNNGTLEPYGEKDIIDHTTNLLESIEKLLLKISKFYALIMGFLSKIFR